MEQNKKQKIKNIVQCNSWML